MNTATAERTDVEVQLDMLIQARIRAKREEDQAIERRREVDAAILGLLPKSDGATTTRVGDFKIVTTYGVTRTVDTETLKAKYTELSPALQAAFRFKADVDAKGWKALSQGDLVVAAQFVNTKPSAPSLKLELA